MSAWTTTNKENSLKVGYGKYWEKGAYLVWNMHELNTHINTHVRTQKKTYIQDKQTDIDTFVSLDT